MIKKISRNSTAEDTMNEIKKKKGIKNISKRTE